MECTVEHDVQPSSKNPEKKITFVRLTDKRPAEDFGEEETVAPRREAAPKASAPKAAEIDLDELLG